jgi:hypothetical protein
MSTPRKVALVGLASPLDPMEIATEGFISGGNRVEVVVSIAATSSMSTTVVARAFVQVVVAIAATSSVSVPVTAAAGVVQVSVAIAAGSSMNVPVTLEPHPPPPPPPKPRPRSSGGGGGGGGGGDTPRATSAFERAFDRDLSGDPLDLPIGPELRPEIHTTNGPLDEQIAAAEERKAEKLRQIEEEEREIDVVRAQIVEVKREESEKLAGVLKTAATALAVYSAVRVAIWLVA